jgi:hypothetical protein
MAQPQAFRLTSQHLTLLQHMYVGWQDMEYGAPEIDPKRPYGNSDVEDDICTILALETMPDSDIEDAFVPSHAARRQAAALHLEMEQALSIVLATASFRPGLYQLTEPYNLRSWVFVHE